MAGTIFSDPNREAVGLDPIYTEVESPPEIEPEAEPEANPLDAMTKDELLAVAAERGIAVPSGATKPEVRALIDGS